MGYIMEFFILLNAATTISVTNGETQIPDQACGDYISSMVKMECKNIAGGYGKAFEHESDTTIDGHFRNHFIQPPGYGHSQPLKH